VRHRRSGARATVTTLAFALLGLGPGPALAHAPMPSSPRYSAVDQNTHAYAYDARTGLMTELESPVGPDGTSTVAGTSQNRYVAGTWSTPTHHPRGATPVYDSKVTSITGHTVVGTFQPKPDGSSDQPAARGFAYDIRTGHTVLATTRPGAYAYDLRSKTLAPFGPGPFGYVYRVDTREFTLLPAVGGVHSTASDVDRHGAAVGNSATDSADPSTPDGVCHATPWTARRD
jgi:hypothetical protein